MLYNQLIRKSGKEATESEKTKNVQEILQLTSGIIPQVFHLKNELTCRLSVNMMEVALFKLVSNMEIMNKESK
jgi:hypothetical protein